MKNLMKETRGAVYVEFLGVFLPLFIFFLCIIQLIFVQTANLITDHAAMTAARAACVVLPDDPNLGGAPVGSFSGPKRADITKAAAIPLSALGPEGDGVTVDLNQGSYGRDDIIQVTVKYDYKCRVPGGALLVCGADGIKDLKAVAEMPNMGADYKYGP